MTTVLEYQAFWLDNINTYERVEKMPIIESIAIICMLDSSEVTLEGIHYYLTDADMLKFLDKAQIVEHSYAALADTLPDTIAEIAPYKLKLQMAQITSNGGLSEPEIDTDKENWLYQNLNNPLGALPFELAVNASIFPGLSSPLFEAGPVFDLILKELDYGQAVNFLERMTLFNKMAVPDWAFLYPTYVFFRDEFLLPALLDYQQAQKTQRTSYVPLFQAFAP